MNPAPLYAIGVRQVFQRMNCIERGDNHLTLGATYQRIFAFPCGLARDIGVDAGAPILVRRLIGRPFRARESAFELQVPLLLFE